MTHTSLFKGSNHFSRENRLCWQLTAPAEGGVGGYINRWDRDFRRFYERLFSTLTGDAHEATRRNMQDERQWVRSFQDILVIPAPGVSPTPNGVFGPREYLLSLTPENRLVEFARFAHVNIPEQVRLSNIRLRTIGVLQASNFEDYLRTHGAAAVANELSTSNAIAPLIQASGILLGEPGGIPASGPAALNPNGIDGVDIAQQTLQITYPPEQLGHLYQDYVLAVRDLQRRNPQPAREQLMDIDFLLENLPPSPLRGFLRATPRDAARNRIREMAELMDKQSQDQQLLQLRSQQDLQVLNKGATESIRNAGRTLTENFENMEPWQQFAVGGLAAFALWTAWKSRGRFLGILPYRWLPPTLIGVYLYQRLVRGNDNALNDMANTLQTGVNIGVNGILSGLRSVNAIGAPQSDVMLRQISLMNRFFNERAFQNIYPASVAFTTLAEARMSNIASAMRPTSDGRGFIFNAPNGSPLQVEMEGIIRRRGYDRNSVYRYLQENGQQTTRAMTSMFFILGSRDPANREVVQRIERARRSVATRENPTPSYDQIQDPRLQAEFIRIVQRGMLMAREPAYQNLTFADLIGRIMEENDRTQTAESAPRIDTAQPVPNVLALSTRTNEAELYQLQTLPIAPTIGAENARIIERLTADFDQFLAQCQNVHGYNFLTSDGAKMIRDRGMQLLNNGTMAERALAIERLKYIVMVAANGSQRVPMNADDIVRLALPLTNSTSGFLATSYQWITQFGSYMNARVLTILGQFHEVNDLTNVRTFLQERMITLGGAQSINGRGFQNLLARVNYYRSIFDRLRTDGGTVSFVLQNAEIAARRIVESNPLLRARFSTEQDAIAAVRNALTHGNRWGVRNVFNERVNRMEQYFAQRCANSIVLAVLTNHQANGQHALTENINDRAITPTEERNLISEWGTLFEQIVGNEENPASGFWGRIETDTDLNGALSLSPDTLRSRDLRQLSNSEQAFSDAALIVRAYTFGGRTFLGIAPDIHGSAIELQERLKQIAISYIRSWVRDMATSPGQQFNVAHTQTLRGAVRALNLGGTTLAVGDLPTDDITADQRTSLGGATTIDAALNYIENNPR